MAKKKEVNEVKKGNGIIRDADGTIIDSGGASVIAKAGGYAYEGDKNINEEMGVKKNIHKDGVVHNDGK